MPEDSRDDTAAKAARPGERPRWTQRELVTASLLRCPAAPRRADGTTAPTRFSNP